MGSLESVVVFQFAVDADISGEGGPIHRALRGAAGRLKLAAQRQADGGASVTEGAPGRRPTWPDDRRRRLAQAERLHPERRSARPGPASPRRRSRLAPRTAVSGTSRRSPSDSGVSRACSSSGSCTRNGRANVSRQHSPRGRAPRIAATAGALGAPRAASAAAASASRNRRAAFTARPPCQPQGSPEADGDARGRQVKVHRFWAALLCFQAQAHVHDRPAG